MIKLADFEEYKCSSVEMFTCHVFLKHTWFVLLHLTQETEVAKNTGAHTWEAPTILFLHTYNIFKKTKKELKLLQENF